MPATVCLRSPISSEETLALLDQDDGSVEDWVDAVGPPTFTPLDFELASESTVGRRFDISYDQLTPSNFDFRIWMGWSQEGRIHVAGQFVDDSYINEYEPVDFRTRKLNGVFSSFDSISLFVDGDHTGGEYRFLASHGELENALKTNMQAQHFEAIARVPGGPMISLNSTTAGAIGFDELDIEELGLDGAASIRTRGRGRLQRKPDDLDHRIFRNLLRPLAPLRSR